MRAKAVVRFDVGLGMQLHAKCRKCVAKFRTALFEVLAWLKVALFRKGISKMNIILQPQHSLVSGCTYQSVKATFRTALFEVLAWLKVVLFWNAAEHASSQCLSFHFLRTAAGSHL